MKNRLIQILVAFLFTFFFFSCYNESSLNKKFNKETFISDLVDIKKSKVLSDEEFEILLNKISDADISNEDLSGKTFKAILKEAKKEHSKELKGSPIKIESLHLLDSLAR